MLENGSFRGDEFYGYIVIEFKPKTNISKFCPDPTYNEWNPKGCSVRVDKTSCSGSIINYGSSIRFISDDTYVEHDIKRLNLFQLLKEVK